jgi:hypothetical protein
VNGHDAPHAVHLLWCPVCGRDDRYTNLKAAPGRHFAGGSLCAGEPQELTYKLPMAPSLPAPALGAFRAAVAVEIAIRPGLEHLDNGSPTFVGRTVTFSADTIEQLAELSALVLENIAEGMPDSIAVHPRPEPSRSYPWATR